jgi:hypothetical protein
MKFEEAIVQELKSAKNKIWFDLSFLWEHYADNHSKEGSSK